MCWQARRATRWHTPAWLNWSSRAALARTSCCASRLTESISRRGGKVFYPDLEFCTDNGAMIAFAGALRLERQQGEKDYRFNVKPRWNLAEITS